MKKNLPVLIFVLSLAYLYLFLTMPRARPVYLSPSDKIFKQEKTNNDNEVFEIIKAINLKNSHIDSIFVKNMPITLEQNKIKIRANGELAMEKEKNFRLEINHKISGKEMDIGSNETWFWFWSKRMNPPYLNFAKHEDLDKTFLRTAINPNWMLESMNIGPINIENIQFYKFKEFYSIIQNRISIMGEPVTAMILIDPQMKVVVGRYLYNETGKIIASTEYKNFGADIARNILIIWYEEGIVLDWDLKDAVINKKIDSVYWEMPNMKNKIDLSK